MPRYIIVINQPANDEADDLDAAIAVAEQLAADHPGVAYDVLEVVAQSIADPPIKQAVIAATQRFRPADVVDVKPAPVDVLPVDVIATP